MNFDSVRSVGRKAGGFVLVAAGIGLGFWFCLILADVLTFVWVYSSVKNAMEGYGMSEYLGKLVAVTFATLIAYFANGVLHKVIKRDKTWVPIVAGVLAAWFVVMYFVSSPYTSGLFNPFTSQAQAVYLRMPDGTIKSFPKGLKFDPDTGKKLKEFDPATAEEYQKQQEKKKRSFGKSPSDPNQVVSEDLVLWTEKIQIAPDRTIVYLACQGKDGQPGWLLPNSSSGTFTWRGQIYLITTSQAAYLVDDSRQAYNLSADTALYDSVKTSSTIIEHWYGDKEIENFWPAHYVRVDETYHFDLTFPTLRQGISQLRLHLAYFSPALDLDSALAKAEKIPPIPQVQPSNPVEAAAESPVAATPSPPPNPVVATLQQPAPVVTPSLTPTPTPQPTSAPLTASPPQPPSPVKPAVPVILSNLQDSDWMISSSEDLPELAVVWLALKRGFTDLQIAARLKNPLRVNNLSDASGLFVTYLKDERGRVYRFREGSSILKLRPDGTDADQYQPYSGSSYLLEVGEVYMFRMSFEPLKDDARELTFYRNDYPPTRLNRQLQELYSSKRWR